MRVEEIAAGVLMFVGDAYESVATAFISDSDTLLIDTLASREDAQWMRRRLVDEMGTTVRIIVATHYMNDHMAGMRLYPNAQIIAQRYFRYTFESQRARSAQDNAEYVEPTAVFDNTLSLQWGRHVLQLFHNPGKTMDSINIDVPGCDIAFVGDNMVGNIVYLSRSSPQLIDQAIDRLRLLQRRRVIGGHIGMFDAATLGNAQYYLRRLREVTVDIYKARRLKRDLDAIRSISLESCLAPGITPCAFEREWHGRNLEVLIEQETFKLDAVQEMPQSSS